MTLSLSGPAARTARSPQPEPSSGPLPDPLAQTRQVIAVEQQGHGAGPQLKSSLEAEPRMRMAGSARKVVAQALRIDLSPGVPPSL